MKFFVVGFLFNEQCDCVVLIEKRKPLWQLGRLNGVGGKIEALTPSIRETPEKAMEREFREETGVVCRSKSWECFCTLTDSHAKEVTVHFLRAFDTLASVDATTTEQERIIKVDPYNLPQHVLPNLRWLIPLALDSSLAAPIAVVDTKIEPRAAVT